MVNKIFFIIIGVLSLSFYNLNDKKDVVINNTISTNFNNEYVIKTSSPSLRLFNAIEIYADSFNIPKRIAYGIAKSESGYDGIFDFNYNPYLVSSGGACGAMQIMVGTAKSINKNSNVTRERLIYDIEFNVMTSMKLLNKLHKKYGDWKIALGCYNTGRPCVNGYANKIYNYKVNWKLKKVNY